MKDKSSAYFSGWFSDTKHITGLFILGASMLLWALGILVELFRAAPGAYISAMFGGLNDYAMPAFSVVMYKISTVLMIAFFAHGLIFYMRPTDVIIVVEIVVFADFIIMFAVDAVIELIAISIISSLIMFVISGSLGMILCMLFPYASIILFPAFIVGLPLLLLAVMGVADSIILILGVLSISIAELITSITGLDRDKRSVFEIPLTLIMILFVAWPGLTIFYNIRGSFANTTGYEIREAIFNSDSGRAQLTSKEMLDNIRIDYYSRMINPGDNGNLYTGGGMHTYYNQEHIYDESDFYESHNAAPYDAYHYYVTSTLSENMICKTGSKLNYQQIKNRGKKPEDAFIYQWKDVTVAYSPESIYTVMHYGDKEQYRKSGGKWYKPFKNASAEELRALIMKNLIRSSTDGNFREMEEFVQVLYAQTTGMLLTYDGETQTALFAEDKDGSIRLLRQTGTDSAEMVGAFGRSYGGQGTGYFFLDGTIYYVDGCSIMTYDLTENKTTVWYDTGEDSVRIFNYIVLEDQSLVIAYVDDEGNMYLLRDGTVVKRYLNENQFDPDKLISMQLTCEEAVIVYSIDKPTLITQLKHYLKNETITYEHAHYLTAPYPDSFINTAK
ncbi:MAG: hypothetical protein MJ175_07315 [Clostridia bacterium]|nr:hypothetical protein [Clostridia bacterium]